jgi:hypothetical protein
VPPSTLLGCFERFLQSHSRRSQQIGRRIFDPILREQVMETLLRSQLQCAIGAAGYVLFEFMAGIVGQLAINMQHNILSNPFTLHNFTFSGLGS